MIAEVNLQGLRLFSSLEPRKRGLGEEELMSRAGCGLWSPLSNQLCSRSFLFPKVPPFGDEILDGCGKQLINIPITGMFVVWRVDGGVKDLVGACFLSFFVRPRMLCFA